MAGHESSREKGGEREDLLSLARLALESVDDMARAFESGAGELRHIIGDLEEGGNLPDVFRAMVGRGSADTRRQVRAAVEVYERELMRFRARMVQVLVDEEGFSLTELGESIGISRQRVARLYQMSQGCDKKDPALPATRRYGPSL